MNRAPRRRVLSVAAAAAVLVWTASPAGAVSTGWLEDDGVQETFGTGGRGGAHDCLWTAQISGASGYFATPSPQHEFAKCSFGDATVRLKCNGTKRTTSSAASVTVTTSWERSGAWQARCDHTQYLGRGVTVTWTGTASLIKVVSTTR